MSQPSRPHSDEGGTVDSFIESEVSHDVNKRTTLEPSVGSVDGTKKKRRRPALSCEQCRKRKVRCDRKEPCSPCTKSKMASVCSYAPTHIPPSWRRKQQMALKEGTATAEGTERSGAPVTILPVPNRSPPITTESSRPVDRKETFITMFGNDAEQTPSDPVSESADPKPAPKNGKSWHASPKAEKVDWLMAKVHYLEEKLSEVVTISYDSPDREHESPADTGSSTSIQGTAAKTRYFGRSHWMNGAAMLPLEIKILCKPDSTKSDLFRLIARAKRLGRRIKDARFKPLSALDLGKGIPDKEIADQFVDAYFRTFEGVLRILHVPSFRSEYDRFWHNREAADDCFKIQLQLVMALGSVFHDETFTYRSMANQWIYEAQTWLMTPPEKSTMTISGIQIMCLLTLARFVCAVGQDLVWITTGGLLRRAMYMGLHRDPAQLVKMTTYRAEMRRRLWATILELNLQSAFDAGGPPLISMEDHDVKPPANLNDDQLSDEMDGHMSTKQSSNTVTQMSVPLELHKSLPLRLNLLRHANDFRAEEFYDETLRFNSKLVQACRALSQSMTVFIKNEMAKSSSPMVTEFHSNMAELLVYRCFDTLHQPVIAPSFDDPRFFFSRKMYLDGGLKILHICGLSGPRRAQGPTAPLTPDSSTEQQSDFNRLITNGSGIFRTIAFQSFRCLVIELLHSKAWVDHTFGMGLGYLPAVQDYDLHRALDSVTGWLLRRIRSGETNIKAYCFLSASRAHINAVETGKDDKTTEQNMIQACERAAQECIDVMKQLAEEQGVFKEDKASEPNDEFVPSMNMLNESWMNDLPMDLMGDWTYDEMPGLLWGAPKPFDDIHPPIFG